MSVKAPALISVLPTGTGVTFTGRGSISPAADGVFTLLDNAGTSFGRVNFGPATASFPAWKRSSTELQARLGDDTDYTGVRAGDFFSANRRFYFASRGSLEATAADGTFNFLNNAGTGVTSVGFGPATSGFPMLKVTATLAAFRLGDNSADAPISTAAIAASGSVTFGAAAAGVVLKQGANGLCGTFVANGTTPVVVSNTNIAISDAIIISLNTVGGTVGVQPHVSAITAATSFAVTCTATDTSTYNYAIIKNAA